MHCRGGSRKVPAGGAAPTDKKEKLVTDSPNPMDPHKGFNLSTRILLHLRLDGVDQQVLALLRSACEKALNAEGIVLSQLEKDRLVKELARSIIA